VFFGQKANDSQIADSTAARRAELRFAIFGRWREERPKEAMKLKTLAPVPHRMHRIRGWRPGALRLALGILLLAFFPSGCRRSPPEPVTLTFVDQEGLHDPGQRYLVTDTALQEFARETGIRVNHLPTPETNFDQLALYRKLLQEGATTPDVYGIDAIWAGSLSEYLIDLKPYFSAELASQEAEMVANYMAGDKLVAMPYHLNTGVLFYRTDLLLRYGYRRPPRTWDELETMALRIQTGERARGVKDFWGFVWPGMVSEALTCNALEWQVDEGGGRIIEADRTISVNNPHAIRAWERAAHWVGRISPPSVLSYEEWDTSNVFWVSGKAAFTRGWSYYFLDYPPTVATGFREQVGVTSVPGGRSARVGTIGGSGLAVSRSSLHRPEAIRLVEFLIQREARIEAARAQSGSGTLSELQELPTILVKRYPRMAQAGEAPGATVVARPSTAAGAEYEDVSQAYIRAVHAVLAGESKAPLAAAALEKELVRITGFKTTHK
jgi:trehalose/maltose transport system substrate-binding protein